MALELGGWFASVVIAKLSDKILTYLADQYSYRQGVKSKLRKLESNLRRLQAAIHPLDGSHMTNPSLRAWLMDLKDATYDAEDVLDKFDYKVLEQSASTHRDPSSSRKFMKQVNSNVKLLFFADEDINQLLEIADRFDEVVDQMSGFLNLLGSDLQQQPQSELMDCRQTTSISTELRISGREKEITQLVSLLQQVGMDRSGSGSGSESKSNDTKENLSIVSIVGIGGVGKTTLAQCVYNDGRLSRCFDIRVWICVSNSFDVKRIMKEVIQSASMKRPHDFHNISSLDKIQEILKRGVMGKRFLIVLDDVWNQTRRKWEALCTPLQFGRRGSRVIVTTRNPKIAQMIGTTETVSLQGLPEEVYWSFFRECAFGDVRLEEYPKLEVIGREIAKKLKGSPLAAKTVGCVLRAKLDGKHWKKILKSKLCEVEQGNDGILPALRLTYDHLPPHLKQCFVFCSLFPRSHIFERESLVRMWIAQGFIQPDDTKSLEDGGREYFDDLLLTSFFQHAGQEDKNKYVIHDLLHELAQSVSLDDYCRIENADLRKISKRVRHLCVTSNKLLPTVYKSIGDIQSLRSLVLLNDVDSECLEMIGELKSLRLLIIWGYQGVLPEAIGDLIHLRYLDVYQTNGTAKLPNSLSRLYHLQGLSLQGSIDTNLPKGINNIINLRYLNASINTISAIAGIGRLTSLQELAEYRVRRDNGHEIGQLSEMKELRGQLQIKHLENVWSRKEATEAKLDNKEHLHELKLEWRYPTKRFIQYDDYESVLEGLRPHSNLVGLGIIGYGGIRSPSWLKPAWLSNLEEIRLEYCDFWEVLPPFGQLHFLKILHLTGLNGVKKIGSEFYGHSRSGSAFPSLEELSFRNMDKWKVWSHTEEGRILFPRLAKFFIKDCPNLKGPLPLPTSLKELVLQTVPVEEDPASLFSREATDVGETISPQLRLYVSDTLQLAGWIPASSLSSLQAMEIRDFSKHVSFKSEEVWFQHLTSLRQLSISNCDNIRILPARLTHLPTLERLRITGCPQIQSLPELGLPLSLKQLLIHCCHPTLMEQFQEEGLAWPKITHVSHVRITDSQNKVVYQRQPSSLPRRRASGPMLMLLIGILLVVFYSTLGIFPLRYQHKKTYAKQFFEVLTIPATR